MRKTLTLGPLSIIFSNENKQMNIPLHHHYAQVRLSYGFAGNAGFPVLAATMDKIYQELSRLVEKPFMNTRNEEVLEAIYKGFRDWECPEIEAYGGEWDLVAVELTVFATRDRLGHAEGPA